MVRNGEVEKVDELEILALLWRQWSRENKTCETCQEPDCGGKEGKNHECYI